MYGGGNRWPPSDITEITFRGRCMRYLGLYCLVLLSACTYPTSYSQQNLNQSYGINILGLHVSELPFKYIESCPDKSPVKSECDGYFLINDGKIAVYYKIDGDGAVREYWGKNT